MPLAVTVTPEHSLPLLPFNRSYRTDHYQISFNKNCTVLNTGQWWNSILEIELEDDTFCVGRQIRGWVGLHATIASIKSLFI